MANTFLKLPEKTKNEQKQGKESWNSDHHTSHPDFYTVGYAGRDINEFIDVLKAAGVATLADIRYVPVKCVERYYLPR